MRQDDTLVSGLQIGIANGWWWCLCRLYANVGGIDDDDSITLPLTNRSFLRRGKSNREAGVRNRQTLALVFESTPIDPFICLPWDSYMLVREACCRSCV
ncbi:uncharacterized protein TrAtP1_000926 [Trichoderma atroviride]|uniref:uncharacterized protein n=1 Tax=Hypocrea atroviridis TaxID=63577 RepID=UPI0033275E6C|nr:hypothetical protein TrAtP1_000926 [Trichoderma atroviride]